MMTPLEDSPIVGLSTDSSYNLSYRMNGMENSTGDTAKGRKNGKINYIHYLHNLFVSAKENHSIEFLMFFHMIGYTCTTVIVQNLYIDRICRIEHQFSPEICENLSHKNYTEQEKMVEKDASYYTMYRSIIEALVPVLFALFLVNT